MKTRFAKCLGAALLLALIAAAFVSCGGKRVGSGLAPTAGGVGAHGGAPSLPTPRGQGGQPSAPTLSLADVLHDIDACPIPKGVSADRWMTLTAELKRLLVARSKDGKTLSVAPSGSDNALKDLKVALNGSQATLTWTERNAGDYALDGEVGIADLGPLAAHYGETVTYGTDGMPTPGVTNEQRGAVDGDGSGEIGISDLGPLAAHYGTTLTGYNVYRETTRLGSNPSVNRGFPFDKCASRDWYVDSASGSNITYYVRPVGRDGAEGAVTWVNTSGGSGQRVWTVMFYFAGDQDGNTSLGHSGNLSPQFYTELNAIESVLTPSSYVTLVTEAKLRRDPFNPASPFTAPPSDMAFRYRMQPDTDPSNLNFGAGSQHQDLGFSWFDSSAPSSITSFIQWAAANFPANHYCLILGDHGGSWLPGGKLSSALIEDDSYNNIMYNSEAAQAVAASGVHIDVLDLDACLMGTVEVADEFKAVCDYLVFSENTSYGFTWLGIGNLYGQPTMTPQALAQSCVSDYQALWQDPSFLFYPAPEAMTLSAVKTSAVPALVSALGTLRSQIVANMSSEKPNLQSAAAGSHEMPPSPETYPGQVDMFAFLESYKAKTSNSTVKTAISAVESALSSAVVAHTHVNGTSETLATEGGLVLYVPTSQQEFAVMDYSPFGAHYRTVLPFNQTTHWYDVLQQVFAEPRLITKIYIQVNGAAAGETNVPGTANVDANSQPTFTLYQVDEFDPATSTTNTRDATAQEKADTTWTSSNPAAVPMGTPNTGDQTSPGVTTSPPPASIVTANYYPALPEPGQQHVTAQCLVQVVGTPGPHSVSGTVLESGSGLAGVTLTLTPGGLNVTTQADGTFTIPGVADGGYTLTPAKGGFSFTPTNRPVTVAGADITGQNFTGTPVPTFTVSGTVTESGSGLAGVLMTLTPGGLNAATQADGTYTITGVADGSYALTPLKTAYGFAPSSRPVTVSGADVAGQDFAAHSPWPKFRQNQFNTGLSQYLGAQTNAVKWSHTTYGLVSSSPAIGADGTVYFGSSDWNVYALNPSNGSVKWAHPTGGSVRSSPAIGADGTVYIGSDDKNVYALNPADGSVKWTHAVGGPVYSSPAISTDGTVFVGSSDKCVYALNPADGSVKWSYLTAAAVASSPAIGVDGTIYVGSYDHNVYALNPSDGSVKWLYATGDVVYSSPAIGADGTVYVGSWDHNVYALDPADGSAKWSYTTGGSVMISSPAISADGTVYVGSNDRKVYALNPSDGSVKWSYATGNWVRSSPAIGADGTVYVGSDDNKIYALNSSNGSVKWSYATPQPVESSPAISADGIIYIGSNDSKLYAIGP